MLICYILLAEYRIKPHQCLNGTKSLHVGQEDLGNLMVWKWFWYFKGLGRKRASFCQIQKYIIKTWATWAGFEPGTSCMWSGDHTTRPAASGSLPEDYLAPIQSLTAHVCSNSHDELIDMGVCRYPFDLCTVRFKVQSVISVILP